MGDWMGYSVVGCSPNGQIKRVSWYIRPLLQFDSQNINSKLWRKRLAMDRYYLLDIIRRITLERDQHDQKFAANPAHKDCLPRFETAIGNLEKELAALPQSSSADSAAGEG